MDRSAYSELNVRELRILDTLLRERSITRTAQSMGTAQPAISKALARLRKQFSDPLFVRNGQAMQPTGAIDGLRAAAMVFDPLRSDRLFSLLLTDVGMVRFLPPLVAHVAAMAPNVSLRAVPLDSRQFELKLEAGEADLALGAFPKAAGHLRRQRLFSDGYLSVIRKRHPRLEKSRSRSGFLAERHILVTASPTGKACWLPRYRLPTSCCRFRALQPAPLSLRKQMA